MDTHRHMTGPASPHRRARRAAATAVIALSCIGIAKAGQDCQPGFVPAHSATHQICVADYSLPFWKSQASTAAHQPTEIWEDRYGAVAYARTTNSYIMHIGARSEKAARESVLEECGAACEILGTFKNGCAAIGWGAGWAHLKHGHSRKDAEEQALASCRADPATRIACEVLYSDCSFPVRLR